MSTTQDQQIALEAEVATGVKQAENEHSFYARIADMKQFDGLPKERQEQWEIKVPKTDRNTAAGGIRVRKTIVDGQRPEYVMTSKVLISSDGKKDEVPIASTPHQFIHFALLSEGGMIKDRFTFPIKGTDLKWEIDLFLKPDGGYHDWCKIDLEVEDLNAPIPQELPIAFTALIPGDPSKRTDAQSAKLRELFDTCFLTRYQLQNLTTQSELSTTGAESQ